MIDADCLLSDTAVIYNETLVNLYGCAIGEHTTIGPFVEIQRGALVGKFSKISSHTFVCGHVTIGDYVFVGHGVRFVDDLGPVIGGIYTPCATVVRDFASIGSGAVILPVTIGDGAVIGAGAVVVDDVPSLAVAVGNPARIVRQFATREERNDYFAGRGRDHPYAMPRRHAISSRIPETGNGAHLAR